MVSVKLFDRNEKSHVGRVIVTKVMIQYSRLGTMVKMPSISPPSMPKADWEGSSGEPVADEVAAWANEVTVLVSNEGEPAPSVEPSMLLCAHVHE